MTYYPFTQSIGPSEFDYGEAGRLWPMVSELRFFSASEEQFDEGVFGTVSCIVGSSLALNHIPVHRQRAGRPFLVFPARFMGKGRYSHLGRMGKEGDLQRIREQILDSLILGGVLDPVEEAK